MVLLGNEKVKSIAKGEVLLSLLGELNNNGFFSIIYRGIKAKKVNYREL